VKRALMCSVLRDGFAVASENPPSERNLGDFKRFSDDKLLAWTGRNQPAKCRKRLMDQLPPSFRLRLENQVSVVTGGTRGIGAAIVRRFVQEGAHVVFSGRSERKGKALEEELGENVVFYRAEAASATQTEALMNFAVEHFGRLDCVVNNAGVGGEGGPIAETSVEGFERSIALMLFGTFFGIKYSVLHMKSGSIINISSISV
jgi:hypothetical protein